MKFQVIHELSDLSTSSWQLLRIVGPGSGLALGYRFRHIVRFNNIHHHHTVDQ